MTGEDALARQALLRRGFALEWATLGWNVVGIVVLANATVGWWRADPAAGYVLVFYAAHEVREILFVSG